MCLLVICILGHVERDPLACHLTNEKLESVCYVHPSIFKLLKSMFLVRAAEVSQHSHQRSPPAAQIRSLPQTCHPKGHQNRT
jgi:hypothetical protein